MSRSNKINNPLPCHQHFDEGFLGYADGHALFDPEDSLLSWSESFADLYPSLKKDIVPGLHYREWLYLLVTGEAIKNKPSIVDLESWLDEQVKAVRSGSCEFVHHLNDDRWVMVKSVGFKSGHWFFAVEDITENYLMRRDLQLAAEKFSQFAEVASDWFWELDEELRYKYHSTHKRRHAEFVNISSLVGVSRLDDVSRAGLLRDDQLATHNRCLSEHKPVDVVLTMENSVSGNSFVQISARPRFDANGCFTGYVGCGRDVTEIFKLQQQLTFHTARDSLTGLLNRRSLMDHLQSRIYQIQNDASAEGVDACVALFNIDHFKLTNDNAGHTTGDRILQLFSEFLEHRLPAECVIARLGGDEFAALIPGRTEDLQDLLQQIVDAVGQQEFVYSNQVHRLSVSVGLVALSDDYKTSNEVLRAADLACYSAKVRGRSIVDTGTCIDQFKARQNVEISNLKIIQSTIETGAFELYLQPIVQAQEHRSVDKFETLIRFFDEKGETCDTGDVIAVAEKYDLMHAIDSQVVQRSLEFITRLKALDSDISLSVNLSGATLGNERYLEKISSRLLDYHDETGNLGCLCLEITETAAIRNVETIEAFIRRFRRLGCEFSLDDFGSGLASFAYLKMISADYLKIDGAFICKILENETDQAIVKSFNTLAHSLGMQTVAEFVESQDIAEYLIRQGVDFLQGYGVGKPEPSEIWFDRLQQQRIQQLRRAG